jgi:hypothetical protein
VQIGIGVCNELFKNIYLLCSCKCVDFIITASKLHVHNWLEDTTTSSCSSPAVAEQNGLSLTNPRKEGTNVVQRRAAHLLGGRDDGDVLGYMPLLRVVLLPTAPKNLPDNLSRRALVDR